MGYNLKNARDGKSISKIPKRPSLVPWDYRVLFVQQFELSENEEDLYGKCCWRARPRSPTNFSYKSSYFSKIQTVIKSHS